MAAIGSLYPTLADIAKTTGEDGTIIKTAEVLTKRVAFLEDIAFRQGNLPTGHRIGLRTALPSPTWRRFNQGVDPVKAENDTLDETCGMLETFSKIDCALADLNGGAAYRADQDKAVVLGFRHEVERALIHESVKVNPERIHGFLPRMSDLANTQVINADADASGANCTSIVAVCWSPESAYAIFPKGSQAGLHREDLGKQLTKDANSKEYTAWVTHWKWDLGLAIEDHRQVAALRNIDLNRITAARTTGADLTMLLTDLQQTIHDPSAGQLVYYMNKKTFGWLNKQLQGRTQNFLEWFERGGRLIPHWMGDPIRITDQILTNESPIT